MCMHWMACLCWRDTKSPSVAIGVFALVTSLMQIAISIAVFTSIGSSADMKYVTNPLYVTLAVFDFVVVLLSILMLVGYERSDACHHWTRFCWVIWMFLYILYESAINIFVFYAAFSPNSPPSLTAKGAVIVFIVYWVCKEIILFIGWLFVLSHLCYGESLSVNSPQQDQTLHVVTGNAAAPIINSNNNNGGVVVSGFSPARPSSNYQVYNYGYSQGGGGGVYMGQNNYQVPARYM